MKIVFVTSTMLCGGAERVLSAYANKLCQSNEVLIIKFDSNPSFYELDKRIRVINLNLFLNSPNVLVGFWRNLKRIYVLNKMFRQISPDLILSFQTQTNIISLLAAKTAGFRIYIFEQINHLYEKSFVWAAIRRIFYPLTNKLFVLTKFDSDYYSKFVKKVIKLHNPVSIKVTGENILEKKNNIILGCGRFVEDKQLDLLIKIFTRLDKKDYKLVIAGDGPLKKECEKLVSSYNLSDRVELIGQVKEIEKLYSIAKIFCLTSKMEGFPNVLIEAMSFGCVPVSFDCITGPSEIITDGVDGYLIPLQNISQFSEKLSILMSDDKLLKEMSQRAFSSSKKFSLEMAMKILENELN